MAAAQAFDQASTRRAVLGNFIENKLPALGVGAEGSTDGVLRVLSVGPGNGKFFGSNFVLPSHEIFSSSFLKGTGHYGQLL